MAMAFRRILAAGLTATVGLVLCGCAAPKNPSFDVPLSVSVEDLDAMRRDPKPLARPLIILAGYGDPGVASDYLRGKLELVIEDERIIHHAPAGCDSFDACRAELIGVVAEGLAAWGDSIETTEVDIVANSMGGLVAAYAAAPVEGEGRLRVRRLFAIAAPFRGADAAKLPALADMQKDMRPGSAFIETLAGDVARRDYELYPYVRLGDTWVGAANTAPVGEVPWWISNPPHEPAHMTAFTEPRIRADIARRLRGETPYTTEPRAPLPE